MKKDNSYIELLNRITDLLMDENTTPKERQILLEAKGRLEKRVTFSNIIWHLKVELTPWAMKSELSKGVGNYIVILLPVILVVLVLSEQELA